MSVRSWLHPAILATFARNSRVRAKRSLRGHTRHPGDAAAIIAACLNNCWNGRTLTASPGHFNMFWTRDLCFSASSLVRLGPVQTERTHASLANALTIWEKRKSHITTTIHPFDRPSDVFDYGVDSLPLLMAALRSLDATDLVERHRAWLIAEIAHFNERVVDQATGLVRADRKFSAHRDTVVNRSNAYGNTMVALLAKTIAETGWFESPFEHHFNGDYGRLLRTRFWVGDRFIDSIDASGAPEEVTSGEANLWPFWSGVIEDRSMMAIAFGTMEREGFTDPLPLRYETKRRPEIEVLMTRILFPDYQGSTVWTSLGAMYISLLRLVDPVQAEGWITRYVELIERDGTFWEVLDSKGQNWISPRWVLIGEESMLWSSIFADVLEHPFASPAILGSTVASLEVVAIAA